jgi:hypothetical protein
MIILLERSLFQIAKPAIRSIVPAKDKMKQIGGVDLWVEPGRPPNIRRRMLKPTIDLFILVRYSTMFS